MFPAPKAVQPEVPDTETQSAGMALEGFRQMVDQMPINVMTGDLETSEIDDANEATLDSVRELEHIMPVKADDLIGACIDIFH